MTKTEFQETMDHWIATGRYYGYPSCCIASFCESADLTGTQEVAHKNTGFIPCHECATKIYNGETTLEDLITRRACPLPFPQDDMDTPVSTQCHTFN